MFGIGWIDPYIVDVRVNGTINGPERFAAIFTDDGLQTALDNNAVVDRINHQVGEVERPDRCVEFVVDFFPARTSILAQVEAAFINAFALNRQVNRTTVRGRHGNRHAPQLFVRQPLLQFLPLLPTVGCLVQGTSTRKA